MFQVIPPLFERLTEVTLDRDATLFSVTGLDLEADGCYLIFYQGVKTTGGDTNLWIFFNRDTTAANYISCGLANQAGSFSARYFGCPVISGPISANKTVFALIALMRCADGYPRAVAMSSSSYSGGEAFMTTAVVTKYITNVKEIDFWHGIDYGVGAGSKMIIFRRRL